MKKTAILIIMSLASIFYVKAQNTQYPQPNSNMANNTLGKFEGTWQWVNNSDTLTLVLKKENIEFKLIENFTMDNIIGYHRYVKDGILVETSMGYINSNPQDLHYTLLGGNIDGDNVLGCQFNDLSKSKSCSMKLVLNAQQNQFYMTMENNEGIRLGAYDWGFTLPQGIILVKQ